MNWLLNGAFRIGRFAQIDVFVHITFVMFVAFRFFSNLQSGGLAEAKVTAIYSAMLFVCVLLHEYGHCFGARAVGGSAEQIIMWPLGGLAFVHAPMRPWEQFVTTAAGPAVNLVLAAIAAIILMLAEPRWNLIISFHPFNQGFYAGSSWQVWVANFFTVNYTLFLFNMMLLMYPFDCARLVHTAVWKMVGLEMATLWVCQFSVVFAVGFGILGIMKNEMIWVALAVMGGLTSWQQYMAAKHGYVYEDQVTMIRPRNERSSRGSLWSRLMGGVRNKLNTDRYRAADENATENPNPGAWERKQKETERLATEVDRILAKVKEQGMNSLSYIERQTLERATRLRREEESEFDRSTKL